MPRGERSARIADLATRPYRRGDGSERRFSARTLWSWWSAYRRHGLDGLLPKRRADHGTRRAVASEVLEAALALRRELPSRSTRNLIHILGRPARCRPRRPQARRRR